MPDAAGPVLLAGLNMSKIIPVEDAVALVQDAAVVGVAGYGTNGVPEKLLAGLETRFLESGEPQGLTLMFAGGIGDGKDRGLNRLGHEGLLNDERFHADQIVTRSRGTANHLDRSSKLRRSDKSVETRLRHTTSRTVRLSHVDP